MQTIALDELETWGTNAPIHDIGVLQESESVSPGAFRLQQPFASGAWLESLVVNRASDTLVVSLHGALDRSATRLPRFERLRLILAHDVSCLFFADPALHLSPRIQLTWYTGWEGSPDLQAEIATQSQRVACAVGAKRIIFVGSSGGGFAALQISALTEGSVAIEFNAQTDIAAYRVEGTSWAVQRDYVRTAWPSLWAEVGEVESGHWATRLDDRISAVRRYSASRKNRVYLVQNEEEFHYEEHFKPFLEAARRAGNSIFPVTNGEGPRHNPPRNQTFTKTLADVLSAERATSKKSSTTR